MWLGLLFFTGSSCPSAIFSTIITNGPATNRVNLVFFSEGYTNGQLAAFLNDATNAADFFLTAEPYAEYSNYFNVFAIFTNSAHSGSTHLIDRSYAPNYTYFNSTYDAVSDYIITIPPNSSNANYNNGAGKIDALLQQYLPNTNHDLPSLLVNDIVAGGSDNADKRTAITSVGNVSYILVHESGHTLGALGDEYTAANPGYPTNDVEPNTTTNTVYSKIKWNAWISNSTPIPTPVTVSYENTVGLFQGAHYHTNGWYRPCENCCMQSFGVGFCPVCQEALVLAIYGRVRPIDGYLPYPNTLSITSPPALSFKLNLLQPATHNLNVLWLTNGIMVGSETSSVLSLLPTQLGNGTSHVEADVWDATSMVHTDTKMALMQTNSWTLNIAIPVMKINLLRWLTNGSFSFGVTGAAPAGVVIQMSTNMLQWTSVQTNSLSGGELFYTNLGAKVSPKRFFRVVTPP